jgi:hypothetical protein
METALSRLLDGRPVDRQALLHQLDDILAEISAEPEYLDALLPKLMEVIKEAEEWQALLDRMEASNKREDLPWV